MVFPPDLRYTEHMNSRENQQEKAVFRTARAAGRIAALFSAVLLSLTCLNACGQKPGNHRSDVPPPEEAGPRDNTPLVLEPVQEGKQTEGTEEVELDFSSKTEGYFSALWKGEPAKIKLQITAGNSVTYTYNLTTDGTWNVFPFSRENDSYKIGVYRNIQDNQYAEVYSTAVDVALDNPFGPFLYPNQYVWFDDTMESVAVGEEVCRPANTDLDAVTYVYQYVVSHVTYDWEEAETVQSGYLPVVDEVLETGKGICFDYAALMATMLRSQQIPTRLEIGYAGSAYHAWISCYVDEIGWIDGLIQFDGENWSLMDPTLAASQGEETLKKFVGDGTNYRTFYFY